MFKTYFDKYETKLGSTQVYLVVYINKKMRFSFNDLKQQFSNYFIYISENYSENDYQNVKLLIKALMKIKNPIMRDNLIFYEDNIAQSIIIYNYLFLIDITNRNKFTFFYEKFVIVFCCTLCFCLLLLFV